jgi:hypothetical protein
MWELLSDATSGFLISLPLLMDTHLICVISGHHGHSLLIMPGQTELLHPLNADQTLLPFSVF